MKIKKSYWRFIKKKVNRTLFGVYDTNGTKISSIGNTNKHVIITLHFKIEKSYVGNLKDTKQLTVDLLLQIIFMPKWQISDTLT